MTYRTHIDMSVQHQFFTELDAQRLQLQVVDHRRQPLLIFMDFNFAVAENSDWGRIPQSGIFFLVRLSGIPLSSLTSFKEKTTNDMLCGNQSFILKILTRIHLRLRNYHRRA